MTRSLALLIVAAFLLALGIGGYLLLRDSPSEGDPTPAPQISADATLTPTSQPTAKPSATASPSATPSPTMTASPTATLATRIAEVHLIMPQVTLSAPSDAPAITRTVPPPVEPLPDATLLPFPYEASEGWLTFESDHPSVRYISGEWTPLQSARASGGQYHYTEDVDARVMIRFRGEALRVRYVGFTNGGTWRLLLNGEPLDQIDSYAPLSMFTGTRVYSFAAGEHTLELVNTGDANLASTGTMLAFDAKCYRRKKLPMSSD